jgi:hypothetical protein
MKLRRPAIFAWILFALLTITALFSMVYSLMSNGETSQGLFTLISSLLWQLLPVEFAFMGVLVLSKQPRNLIGWLLMLPAVALAPDRAFGAYFDSFASAPPDPSPLFLLVFWFSTWSWLLVIFPVFLIMLLFPTGQPISSRWRWATFYVIGVCVYFFLIITFQQNIESQNADLVLRNPVGFISSDFTEKYLIITWALGLLSTTIIAVASIFVRYRRALVVEREQIKWLLYACGLFGAVYLISLLQNVPYQEWGGPSLFDYMGSPALMTIPAAIAIAILRYRLWDIDVIIRKTLVYGALTATLALVYFGSVVLLQGILTAADGPQTAAATVISTLLIAALFNPLRRRIQRDIDRRFYRKKYDAEKTIANFSAGLRQEVNLEEIGERLLAVAEETMQPESVSLWLRVKPKSK